MRTAVTEAIISLNVFPEMWLEFEEILDVPMGEYPARPVVGEENIDLGALQLS